MYISNLKIHGFKSFANKEQLSFGEGITAVVGPNGCGKTNIVDAIRWVLGEQKYSILRGGKMEDVIFNGAAGLKPLSVCDVSLTVHNNKGKLPLEYNDIEIGRRVYRNGESEYFLNRQPCRLKDIQDLFIDTGMGADAYSVIELKMIEQILSETGDDRKRMFEEAAGINKYKQQRKATLRKFDATHQDLQRIKDIIAEVESKVHGLNLQLKRFKRHAKLTEQLKTTDVILAFLRVQRLSESVDPLKKKIREIQSLRDSKTSKEDHQESELQTLKKSYAEQDEVLNSLQSQFDKHDEIRQKLNDNILVWTEQRRSSESTIERLQQEKQNNRQRIEQFNQQISEYAGTLEKLAPEVDEKLTVFKQRKEEFDEIDKQYNSIRETVKNLQSQRWEAQRILADKESLIKRTTVRLEEQTGQKKSLKDQIQSLTKKAEILSKDQQNLEAKQKSISETLQESKQTLQQNQQKLDEIRAQQNDLVLNRHKISSRIEALQSQVSFYTELMERREGYPEGVRTVLDNVNKYEGIVAPLGELFSVESDWEPALEQALGSLAQALVIDTRAHALKLMAQARKQNIGELRLIPLREISDLDPPELDIPQQDGVIGPAVDLIKTDPEFQPFLTAILGSLLLVDDLDNWNWDESNQGWDVVDRHGRLAKQNGLFIHPQGSQESTLIGRRTRLSNLEKSIEELKSEEAEIIESQGKIGDKFSRQQARINQSEKEVKNQENSLSELESEILRRHYDQSRALENVQSTKTQLNKTDTEIQNLNDALERLKPESYKQAELVKKIDEELSSVDEQSQSIRTDRDKVSQRVQDTRIELVNLENRRDTLNLQRRTTEETQTELIERNKRIDEEIQDLHETINNLNRDLSRTDTERADVTKDLDTLREEIRTKREDHQKLYRSIERLQLQIRDEQRSRESLLEELKQAELSVSETEQEILRIRERIQDNYAVVIPDSMEISDGEDEDSLQRSIERIQRSIENIGPVNMAVQDEYDEANSRLELLLEQREDLIKAEENLRETIQKIDRVARKKFTDTFEQIKLNFEKLFTMYFEGGKGSLSLVGNPDPLEADVAIRAQPPGKRNQSLRMLSAGEKSLTAIALLFAIYQHKPSPYCILDEVDAPLDDVNIKKFTRVLKTFGTDTQFIVVTHNKLTMEAADYLYGVTMEKKGVSKLVSVKFNGQEVDQIAG